MTPEYNFEEMQKKVMANFGGWYMCDIVEFLEKLIRWNRDTARAKAQEDLQHIPSARDYTNEMNMLILDQKRRRHDL